MKQFVGYLIKKAVGKGKVSPDIKSVKPSVGKTKLQKELSNIRKEGKKSVGKIKKDHMKNMAPLDKAHSSLRQNIQKLKGEPVTKSGLSKGKDLRDKKMGGGMMGRRFGYKGGKLVGNQKKIDVAAPFGTINEKDFSKLREGKRMQASVGGGADMGRKPKKSIIDKQGKRGIIVGTGTMDASPKVKTTQRKSDRSRKIGSNVYRRKP
jgi:hypothetical protein|tara:strand:- start:74 stop:694 length:621 start_codon:yes stop_codon:yes gene_type:complete